MQHILHYNGQDEKAKTTETELATRTKCLKHEILTNPKLGHHTQQTVSQKFHAIINQVWHNRNHTEKVVQHPALKPSADLKQQQQ